MKKQPQYFKTILYLYFRGGCARIWDILEDVEDVNPMYVSNMLFRLQKKNMVVRRSIGEYCLSEEYKKSIDKIYERAQARKVR